MMRKLIALALGGLAALTFAACSADESKSSVGMSVVVTSAQPSEASAQTQAEIPTGQDEKVQKLADALNNGVEYGEDLTALDGGGLSRVYRMDGADVADAAGYTGSGATVDQISVWKAVDGEAAGRIKDQLQKFLESQIESYSTYMPDQVPKLEKAILEQNGQYVALCVSEDANAAAEVIATGLAG